MEASKVGRVKEIQRTLRYAQATRSTDTDSWLNGYQKDVAFLLDELAPYLAAEGKEQAAPKDGLL